MHTCTHAYMHTCIHAYMRTCIHAYTHRERDRQTGTHATLIRSGFMTAVLQLIDQRQDSHRISPQLTVARIGPKFLLQGEVFPRFLCPGLVLGRSF